MNSFSFTIVADYATFWHQHVRTISLQEATSKDELQTSHSRVAINEAVLDADSSIVVKELPEGATIISSNDASVLAEGQEQPTERKVRHEL